MVLVRQIELRGSMRGDEEQQVGMFSYVMPEQRVPQDHPLRPLLKMTNEVLAKLSPVFDSLYSRGGRPSIPPEYLLRALLLQVLYSIRSERMLIEQLDYNLLFRWFVGLAMDAPVWDPTTFTKNRERLLSGDVAEQFFAGVLALAREAGLLSDEHFSVDGTLIEAWASHKSFKRKDGGGKPPEDDDPGNPTIDFKGEKRSNATHESTTDPESRLYRKGNTTSKLSFMGHALIENRNGLVVNTALTLATGTAEREAAETMLNEIPGQHRATVGADKGYDVKDFIDKCRELDVTPHVAQNTSGRKSAIDARTTRHAGYAVSIRIRKRIEEVFGWLKTVGGLRKTRHKGTRRVGWQFTFAAAAYNLVRMRNIAARA